VSTDERHIEAAEAAVAMMRDRAIAKVQASIAGVGAEDCIDCGEEIEPARRAALPSAKRCVSCQGKFEGRGSRGY